MNFAEAALRNAAFTRTENGAVALNTTGDARLDFFGTAGSLRTAQKERPASQPPAIPRFGFFFGSSPPRNARNGKKRMFPPFAALQSLY